MKKEQKNNLESSIHLEFLFSLKKDVKDTRDFGDILNKEHCLKK
jgi:hypothetical protein